MSYEREIVGGRADEESAMLLKTVGESINRFDDTTYRVHQGNIVKVFFFTYRTLLRNVNLMHCYHNLWKD